MKLNKKRYTDNETSEAITIALNKGLTKTQIFWTTTYRYTIPNKAIIEAIEKQLNNIGESLQD